MAFTFKYFGLLAALSALALAPSLVVAAELNPISAEVRTLDDRTLTGSLVELTPSALVLRTGEKQQSLAVSDLLSVRLKSAAPVEATKPAVWLELTDGSQLSGVGYTSTKGTAKLVLGGQDALEIPTSSIRVVRFSDPSKNAVQWDEALGRQVKGDVLAVRKKESIDFLEGVAGNFEAEAVQFQLDGDAIPVKRQRVDGLIYFHRAGSDLPDAAARVDDVRGWQLQAKSVTLKDGRWQVVTVTGLSVSRPLEIVSQIDFSAGKLSFLSDIKPESAEWTSFIDFGKSAPSMAQFYVLRQNRGQEGPLRLRGKNYAKGLAIFPLSTVVYRVPAKARQFRAVAGIDDAFREAGSVQLKIFGDAKLLLEETLLPSDAPRPIELNVEGVKRLKVVVAASDDMDITDQLDLCEARIVK